MAIAKCKYCDKHFDNPMDYVSHLESMHEDMIPEDMVPYQFYYFLKTGKSEGKCVICGKKTTWNPKTNKYNRFCENPRCKEKYIQTFRNRMIGKYGKITLLNDPEQQKKMLANRKISGVYKWQDGGQTTYTGSYELSFLEFLDLVMDYESTDVMAPSPHTYYYDYEGIKHFYIPDFFIPSLDLEIEIKDGGDNANMHPKIQAVDKVKESLKDEVMKSNNSNFNYLKITNKDNKKFFRYLELAKKQFFEGIKKPIFMTESVIDDEEDGENIIIEESQDTIPEDITEKSNESVKEKKKSSSIKNRTDSIDKYLDLL
jgi:hypothetical protein